MEPTPSFGETLDPKVPMSSVLPVAFSSRRAASTLTLSPEQHRTQCTQEVHQHPDTGVIVLARHANPAPHLHSCQAHAGGQHQTRERAHLPRPAAFMAAADRQRGQRTRSDQRDCKQTERSVHVLCCHAGHAPAGDSSSKIVWEGCCGQRSRGCPLQPDHFLVPASGRPGVYNSVNIPPSRHIKTIQRVGSVLVLEKA